MTKGDRGARLRNASIGVALGAMSMLSSVGLNTALAGQGAAAALLVSNAQVVDVVAGEVIAGATVFVLDGVIEAVSADAATIAALAETASRMGAEHVDLGDRYLVPGLIDAHVHIGSVDAARRAARSGVTTARSMGAAHFADVGLRELAAMGAIESPRILAAGYHVRPEPAEAFFLDFPALARLRDTGVRGPEAMQTMALALISRDVDFLKTNATERAGLPETDPRKPFYGEEELHALVETGGGVGVPVAAHAHGDTGGRAAVLAGVRSIEHGTYLSETTLRLMADRGTYLVPTIAVVVDLTGPGGDYDDPVLEIRGRHMLPRVRETAAMAHRLGVPIVAATDTGYGSGSVLRLPHELMELAAIGMSPIEALRAATTTAATLMGIEATTGQIAEHFEADFVAVERNPLEDIAALQDILFVAIDGRVIVNRLGY